MVEVNRDGDAPEKDIVRTFKSLLGVDASAPDLHDIIATESRSLVDRLATDDFSIQNAWSPENFASRVQLYDDATARVASLISLLGYWGEERHYRSLAIPFVRIADLNGADSGKRGWLQLQWYPALVLMYFGGVACVIGSRYDGLLHIFGARVRPPSQTRGWGLAIEAVVSGLGNIQSAFKGLPGHGSARTPMSDHLYALLQEPIEQLFGLGSRFEWAFDRFEVLLALEHASLTERNGYGRFWGPVGRFGWMYHRRDDSSPLRETFSEAQTEREAWGPVGAGLFEGSIDRFDKVAAAYSEYISGLGWY